MHWLFPPHPTPKIRLMENDGEEDRRFQTMFQEFSVYVSWKLIRSSSIEFLGKIKNGRLTYLKDSLSTHYQSSFENNDDASLAGGPEALTPPAWW